MKRATRIVISLLLTAGFLYVFLRSFDLSEAWEQMRGAHVALIAASAAINLSAYLVRAWRWRFLMAPLREGIGMYNLTSTTMIGFMISFLVPFRAGEVVRPVLLARREQLSSSAAVATIALERLLDALTIMTLFVVFALSAHGSAVLSAEGSRAALFLRQGLMVTAGFLGVGIPIVVLLVIFPQQALGLLARISPGGRHGPLAAAFRVAERFLSGLGAVRRANKIVAAVILSFMLWLMIDLSVYVGLLAFGLPMSFFDTFLLMVPLAIGIAVPTPGGVGAYEYLGRTALAGFWGVPVATAAAVAVALHAVTLVPTVLTGLLFMWRDGVRPREVSALSADRELSGPQAEVP